MPIDQGSLLGRVRDKLVNGELDAAHVLYGLIYGVQLGHRRPEEGHERS
jgi:nitrate/nitrite transport system substrate-binding protein